MKHREAATGVLVVETQIANGKAGVIAGSAIALAVDAGIDDTEGGAVLAAAQSFGCEEIHLVYTHGHTDHALGGTAFRGRPIYARSEVSAHMRAQLEAWAARDGESSEELEARLGWPTVSIDGDAAIDLGGRTVQLIDTPGHAPGAICVFDPDASVLFGGDTVVTVIPPAFSDGDGEVLAATLRQLAALGAEILVPGHGEVVVGRDPVRAAIEWSAEYLERCQRHVQANLDLTEDAMVAAAPYDAYIGNHLPRDRYRMEWRHEQTLRTLRRTAHASGSN